MRDVCVILTAFNRPHLVQHAIASVLEQDCDRARLIIMDDGSDDATRAAIHAACAPGAWLNTRTVAGGLAVDQGERLTWWYGPHRSMAARKATISYSRTINIALNYLLRDECYVCFLCDDDELYRESVRRRAEYLDEHPEVHVVYGRLRSVQYDADTRNAWTQSIAPSHERLAQPHPTGTWEFDASKGNGRWYFENGDTDPDTGAPFVDVGYWQLGPSWYGKPYSVDHNMVMHRRECLGRCRMWPARADYVVEYWGEDLRHAVGDAAFFRLLGEVHPFVGVDCWAVSKRFHALSDGVTSAEVRE